MNIPALTSPELVTLTNTKHSLDARERLVKADVILLRERIAAGNEIQADDKAAQIEHTLAGGSVSAASDPTAQLSLAMMQWRAIDDAKDVLGRKIAKARYAAATKLCDGLKPAHDAVMQRLCASLVEAHAAHAELFEMKRELTDRQIGLIGTVCHLMPDFLGAP